MNRRGFLGFLSGVLALPLVAKAKPKAEIPKLGDPCPLPRHRVGSRVCYWTGEHSGDWSTAGNWSEGYVPQTGDKVVIGHARHQIDVASGDETVVLDTLEVREGGRIGRLT